MSRAFQGRALERELTGLAPASDSGHNAGNILLAMDGCMSSLPKYHSLLLVGLAQSYASPGEMPLHSTKAQAGLFPSSALGKAAAQSAQDSGWLTTVRTEARGKSNINYVTLTDQGTAYLLEQTDPKPLLEQVHSRLKTEEARLQDVQAMVRGVTG